MTSSPYLLNRSATALALYRLTQMVIIVCISMLPEIVLKTLIISCSLIIFVFHSASEWNENISSVSNTMTSFYQEDTGQLSSRPLNINLICTLIKWRKKPTPDPPLKNLFTVECNNYQHFIAIGWMVEKLIRKCQTHDLIDLRRTHLII